MPLGSSKASVPFLPTEKPEIVPEPAFAVYSKRPFFVAISQHGAA
jgi:hypothetical protein